MNATGYSGTPLPRKLGIREGDLVAVVGDPGHFRQLVGTLPEGARVSHGLREAEVVVVFATERDTLSGTIEQVGKAIFPNGSCWVAWPKKASKVRTDITENVVRELALPLGLVDNKVCAIDEVWSGLRLVWRKERRTQATY